MRPPAPAATSPLTRALAIFFVLLIDAAVTRTPLLWGKRGASWVAGGIERIYIWQTSPTSSPRDGRTSTFVNGPARGAKVSAGYDAWRADGSLAGFARYLGGQEKRFGLTEPVPPPETRRGVRTGRHGTGAVRPTTENIFIYQGF